MLDRSGIAYVDGHRLRRALIAACGHARKYKGELNRINVFPVADGDTGTNLTLTLDAVVSALTGSRERRIDRVAASVAHSAVLGARGNCGMMLSQFLLGFSGGVDGRPRVSLGEFAGALEAGARVAGRGGRGAGRGHDSDRGAGRRGQGGGGGRRGRPGRLRGRDGGAFWTRPVNRWRERPIFSPCWPRPEWWTRAPWRSSASWREWSR